MEEFKVTTTDSIFDESITSINEFDLNNKASIEYTLSSSVNRLSNSNSDYLSTYSINFNLEDIGTIKDLSIVDRLKSLRNSKNFSKTLQSWRGIISKLDKDSFEAELIDLSNGGTKETIRIDKTEVSPDDIELLELGAVFYWHIGQKMHDGQVSKESIIRFQRAIVWSQSEFDKAIDRANEIYKLISSNK